VPRPHQTMCKVREILRLRWSEQLSLRDVATALAMPHATVALYERRALDAGLTWPLPELDGDALEVGPRKKGPRRRARSDPHSRSRRTGRPRVASRLPRHASEGRTQTGPSDATSTRWTTSTRARHAALRVGADFSLLSAAVNLARLAKLGVRSTDGGGWAVVEGPQFLSH
jgi:hypothetical protein